MALIRVTRSYQSTGATREGEIILNTAQITFVHPDEHERGCVVQLVQGEPILIKLSFDELWTLIQRET